MTVPCCPRPRNPGAGPGHQARPNEGCRRWRELVPTTVGFRKELGREKPQLWDHWPRPAGNREFQVSDTHDEDVGWEGHGKLEWGHQKSSVKKVATDVILEGKGELSSAWEVWDSTASENSLFPNPVWEWLGEEKKAACWFILLLEDASGPSWGHTECH